MAAIDFRDPVFRRNPDHVLDRLRREEPVARIRRLPSYLVTRYEDCAAILSSAAFGFEEEDGKRAGRADYGTMRNSMMVFQDGPRHHATRLEGRKMLGAGSPAEVEQVVLESAREVMAGRGWEQCEDDFVAGWARPFTATIAEKILGGGLAGSLDFQDLTRRLTGALDPLGPENSVAEAGRLYRLLEGGAEEGGCPIHGGAEPFLMLVMASTFTTNHILGLVVQGLLEDPALATLLREKWDVRDEAVEELFRFFSPVQMTRRVAREEVVVGGRPFPASTIFWLSLRSANRDEAVFEDPERLRLDRTPNRHLAFGKGVHHCLGAHLARIQLRVFLEEFAGAFPAVRLVPGGSAPLEHPVFRGFDRLTLSWAAG